MAIVFDASEAAGELEQPITALVGVEAYEEGGKAVLARNPIFFIIRRALSLSHLVSLDVEAGTAAATTLKDAYLQLQSKLRAGPDVVQRYEDKTSYLTHFYGAMMGKVQLSEQEAYRAARAIVRAMAYKELGNVNDLVRDEILDPRDFTKDLSRMRELMQSMASLKKEAERLKANLDRLENVRSASQQVVGDTRRFVVERMAHAMGVHAAALEDLERTERGIEYRRAQVATDAAILNEYNAKEERLREQLAVVQGKLSQSEVGQQRDMLKLRVGQLREQFLREWTAARDMISVLSRKQNLLNLLVGADLTMVPALKSAVVRAHPLLEQLETLWKEGLSTIVATTPSIDVSLHSLFRDFHPDTMDVLLGQLNECIHRGADSVMSAVSDSLDEISVRRAQLLDQKTQRDVELDFLQRGRSSDNIDVHQAIALLEQKIPDCRPYVLSQLIEPREPGSDWQRAIEGYMGNDRFAIIVDAGYEAQCAKLVKHRFPRRSPKVVQGSKAIEDSRTRHPDAAAVVNELQCSHPVAKAFLIAQYGRVRKVASENELARTAQGLMESGLGSRGYGMFSCRLDENELAFGEASRKRRMKWCESELARIAQELLELTQLTTSLRAVFTGLGGGEVGALAQSLQTAEAARVECLDIITRLSMLDTSSLDELEAKYSEIDSQIKETRASATDITLKQGAVRDALVKLERERGLLLERMPGLENGLVNSRVWASRYVQGAPTFATEHQLLEEAASASSTHQESPDRFRFSADEIARNLPDRLRAVNVAASIYLSNARTDDERFLYEDPPRTIEALEVILAAQVELLANVDTQSRRQGAIGLAQNVDNLQRAEGQFNAVFTTNFCFKMRDEIKQGAATLERLRREIRGIQFGYDTYELDWVWIPKFKRYFDFFEEVERLVDDLEKEKVSIFDSSRLTEEHRQTAGEIRAMLLSSDQSASERALHEVADYRNYRRYDIIRHNRAGTTRLSTWGTGSGGELETPFYVIRSAVLAHALGHFSRDRKGAPALRLMLSDEAFAKMDESRSRGVLQFLSQTLGLQLIVAMPTSKSGAVKPEFQKEFTFSKLVATQGDKEVFVSEVQEKTFKQAPMRRLWLAHAERARELGRAAYEARQQAQSGSTGKSQPGPTSA